MAKIVDMSKYSVVLISAGMGRRLGNLGRKKPKCLLKIKKKTLIELIIGYLKRRKVTNLSIMVGYKSKIIINFLKKIKGIKVNFIPVYNYNKNGHGYTWYMYKNQWNKEKKPMLLMHADIHFDPSYLDNIINSKKKNIIGIKSYKNHTLKKESIVVRVNKKNKVQSIDFLKKINIPKGEIIGINKLSKKTSKKIFCFMNNFFNKKDNKTLPWEIVIDKYLRKTNDSLFVLNNQNFPWVNINTIEDYKSAKLLKFN